MIIQVYHFEGRKTTNDPSLWPGSEQFKSKSALRNQHCLDYYRSTSDSLCDNVLVKFLAKKNMLVKLSVSATKKKNHETTTSTQCG
jgi:hypothetical protein